MLPNQDVRQNRMDNLFKGVANPKIMQRVLDQEQLTQPQQEQQTSTSPLTPEDVIKDFHMKQVEQNMTLRNQRIDRMLDVFEKNNSIGL